MAAVASGRADPAVGANLGVVADASQQPVDDARRSPAPAREDADGFRLDVDAEDAGRARDDRRQLLLE